MSFSEVYNWLRKKTFSLYLKLQTILVNLKEQFLKNVFDNYQIKFSVSSEQQYVHFI